MLVFFVDLYGVQFHIAFGTQEHPIRSIISNNQAETLQINSEVKQARHYIDQLSLVKSAVPQFFLLYGLLEGKIIVVAEGMNFGVLDAHMNF